MLSQVGVSLLCVPLGGAQDKLSKRAHGPSVLRDARRERVVSRGRLENIY